MDEHDQERGAEQPSAEDVINAEVAAEKMTKAERRRQIELAYKRESPWTTQGSFDMKGRHEYPRPHDWEERLSSAERQRLNEIEKQARERYLRALADLDSGQLSAVDDTGVDGSQAGGSV